MTLDEIKQQYSMRDIIEMYGGKVNRAGMTSCKLHGADKHPSMKVYPTSCHCFACGANCDVISYVMKMENCSFKEAFKKLGGTYEHESETKSRMTRYRLQMQKEQAQLEAQKKIDEKRELMEEIDGQKRLLKRIEGSDMWFDVLWKIEKLQYKLDYMNGFFD